MVIERSGRSFGMKSSFKYIGVIFLLLVLFVVVACESHHDITLHDFTDESGSKYRVADSYNSMTCSHAEEAAGSVVSAEMTSGETHPAMRGLPTITIAPSSTRSYYLNLLGNTNPSWPEDFLLHVLWISGMDNREIQYKANQSIYEAMFHDAEWWTTNVHPGNLNIYFQSDRYLSFIHTIGTDNPRVQFHDFITIDMQTGYRVTLDDLIDVNEAFVDRALEVGYLPFPWDDGHTSLDRNVLLSAIEQASIIQSNSSVFALQESQLIIIILQDGGLDPLLDFDRIIINLSDIEDFLNVEKW